MTCHCLLVTMMMLYLPNIRLRRFFPTTKNRITTTMTTTTMYQWKLNQWQNPRTWKLQKTNAKTIHTNQDKRKKRLNKCKNNEKKKKNPNFGMLAIANGFSIRELRIIVSILTNISHWICSEMSRKKNNIISFLFQENYTSYSHTSFS